MNKVLLLLLFPAFINAQSTVLKSLEDCNKISEEVTKNFLKGDYSAAVDEMSAVWPISDQEKQGFLDKTIQSMPKVNAYYGEFIGYEKIEDEKLGTIGYTEIYALKMEKSALRMIFIYYKGEDGWILHSFTWDDGFKKMFKLNLDD